MPFAKPLPEWNAVGVEPPQALKDEGWKPIQKPPADYFNWYMYHTYQALLELQKKAGEVKTVNGQAPDANGNIPVAAGVTSVNGQSGAITGIETTTGAQQKINTAIANLVNSSPATLDTLAEIADALGRDPNFANTVLTKIGETDQKVTSHLAETASKFTTVNVNMIDMAVELETLKGATLSGITANIFIETFQNLDDINLTNGVYDSVNKRLVL